MKKDAKKEAQAEEESFGLKLHKPVEPIPDHDWKGETWGLYWPDLEEFTELLTEAKEKKHYENRSAYPPAEDTCQVITVEALLCPKPKAPTPPPPRVVQPPPPPPRAVTPPPRRAVTPPPVVKRREKKPTLPELVPKPKEEEEEVPDRWGWVRDKTDSARRARFTLSVYWG